MKPDERDAEIARLREQLRVAREGLDDAAKSLATIAEHGGRQEVMQDMMDTRGYANSRSTAARDTLTRLDHLADPSKKVQTYA